MALRGAYPVHAGEQWRPRGEREWLTVSEVSYNGEASYVRVASRRGRIQQLALSEFVKAFEQRRSS